MGNPLRVKEKKKEGSRKEEEGKSGEKEEDKAKTRKLGEAGKQEGAEAGGFTCQTGTGITWALQRISHKAWQSCKEQERGLMAAESAPDSL